MEHCNGFLAPTKVEENLGTSGNGPEDKVYFPNSYSSLIGMVLYLV